MAVVLLVLEAMTWSLAEPWMARGHLPHLKDLADRGAFLEVDTPSEISSVSASVTLHSGLRAGRHGVGFLHRQLRTGTYDLEKRYAETLPVEPFWNLLSRSGRRVGVFDAPACVPPEDLNGAMVVGWGDEHRSCDPQSRPAHLVAEVHRRFGRHPRVDWYQDRLDGPEDWECFTADLEAAAATRARIIRWLWDSEPFDFFMASFAEHHWAGHMMWHLSDPAHPEHDPRCGNPVLRVYQAVDRALGDLLPAFAGHDLLVTSATSLGPTWTGDHLTQEILHRGGFSEGPRTEGLSVAGVERVVPGRVIQQVKRLFPTRLWDRWSRRFLGLGHRRARSLAFQVPGDQTTVLRLNLQGREPRGRVAPEEYGAVCDRLETLFLGLVNPETGRPAVAEVVRVRQRYPGERVDDLPDLAVIWDGTAPIRAVESPQVGRVESHGRYKRTGSHRRESFLLTAGPRFRSDGRPPGRLDLADVAPTVFHLLGLPVPQGLDGRVLEEILAAPARA